MTKTSGTQNQDPWAGTSWSQRLHRLDPESIRADEEAGKFVGRAGRITSSNSLPADHNYKDRLGIERQFQDLRVDDYALKELLDGWRGMGVDLKTRNAPLVSMVGILAEPVEKRRGVLFKDADVITIAAKMDELRALNASVARVVERMQAGASNGGGRPSVATYIELTGKAYLKPASNDEGSDPTQPTNSSNGISATSGNPVMVYYAATGKVPKFFGRF